MAVRAKFTPKQREALRLIAQGRFYPGLEREDDGWHARWRAVGGDSPWVDEYVRAFAMTRLSEDAEDQRHETLHDAWMMALRSRTGLVRWDDAECERFAAELREWSGAAEEDVAARAAVAFDFSPGNGEFEVSCAVPSGLRAYRALGQSAFVFPPLRGLHRAGPERLAVRLSRAEAESFVRGGARDLRESGYAVRGVDLASGVSASADVDGGEAPPPTSSGTARVRLTVRVAGEPVTAEDIRFLLDQGSSLVFFRNRWIQVDRDLLRQALRALEKGERRIASPVAFALGLGRIGSLELESVSARGWLRGLVSALRAQGDAGRRPGPSAPLAVPGLAGDLRPYQARGVAWLRFLTDRGFGALLADDMGLGKTIQAIAWMLLSRAAAAERRPTLVVAPLTLLANWRRELARFAPGLAVYVHQGDLRHAGSGFRRAALAADVVVTSYGLLVKDYADVSEVAWDALVLDEAQAVKNPDTRAAQAVRALLPPKRLALTGTPVENSVEDVWSLEEFLNPGFLGDRKSFVERFAKPIAMDEASSAGRRLRHALEPFVLRRLKSDPEIAAELGPKREIKEYCRLTDAQRRDYEAALEDFRANERAQGDVFALITALKLVCDGEGKLERLVELLEQVFASGESALVFTQYAKVGAWLRKALEERFGRRFPFLHGALGVREREEAIRAFNRRGGAFILSLRAGGYGLNLTRATHVIHFDRWWNPAVENQATDRAHRIGQTRTVFVHQFITTGTLEERVDDILERKSRIAGTLVQSGEGWLAGLDRDALLETVACDPSPA